MEEDGEGGFGAEVCAKGGRMFIMLAVALFISFVVASENVRRLDEVKSAVENCEPGAIRGTCTVKTVGCVTPEGK